MLNYRWILSLFAVESILSFRRLSFQDTDNIEITEAMSQRRIPSERVTNGKEGFCVLFPNNV
jgi:hypothetical protein